MVEGQPPPVPESSRNLQRTSDPKRVLETQQPVRSTDPRFAPTQPNQLSRGLEQPQRTSVGGNRIIEHFKAPPPPEAGGILPGEQPTRPSENPPSLVTQERLSQTSEQRIPPLTRSQKGAEIAQGFRNIAIGMREALEENAKKRLENIRQDIINVLNGTSQKKADLGEYLRFGGTPEELISLGVNPTIVADAVKNREELLKSIQQGK